ncbi:MAG: amidase [Candidatus Thiodiazotropha sp.]
MLKITEYDNYDALGLAELVRNGDLSANELLSEAKSRLAKVNPKLNAVIYQADDLPDRLIKNLNKESLFCGVPFLVKDLMLPFKGMPLSNGMKAMRSFVPDKNSPMANRIMDSGLIPFGKTTTSELGALQLAKTEAFGETLNPWDSSKNSGGSSGGSSVVVATRVVPMAYASDGGGSIRLPASYCGIFGFKPSRGINRYDDFSNAWGDFVVSHVSTISVRDSAAYLDLIAGNSNRNDSLSNPVAGSYLRAAICEESKLNIGLITESPTATPVHPDCITAAEQAAKLCEDLGHGVFPAKWNFDGRDLMRAFITIVMYFTHRDVVEISARLGIDPNRLDIELYTKFLSVAGSGISQDKLEHSMNICKSAYQSISVLHQQFDLILTPTVATPPLESDAVDPNYFEKIFMRMMVATGLGKKIVNRRSLDLAIDKSLYVTPFTPIANVTGQPAMSVPLYWDDDGLPHGAHFMADVGGDGTLLMLARQLECVCPWVNKVPHPRY